MVTAVTVAVAPSREGTGASRARRVGGSRRPPHRQTQRRGPAPTEPERTCSRRRLNRLVAQASLPNLLAEWVQRIVVPPSASAPFPTPQFPPVVGAHSDRQQHQNDLQRRRAVGAVGLRSGRVRGRLDSVRRLVGAADHRSSTTSASASSAASRSTSPIGSTGEISFVQGSGQCRRRHHQLVHLLRERPTGLLAAAAAADSAAATDLPSVHGRGDSGRADRADRIDGDDVSGRRRRRGTRRRARRPRIHRDIGRRGRG